MNIYIINHKFHYEMENLTRIFFPNEKLNIIKDLPLHLPVSYISTEMSNNGKLITVSVKFDGYYNALNKMSDVEFKSDTAEREMAVLLFMLLSEYTRVIPPWGILTGVRPIKLLRKLTEKLGTEKARSYFTDKLLVSEEKTDLSITTEKYEKPIIELSGKNSFSLYVSIPFCPSRCSYCSFVSQSIEKAKKLIEPYLQLLCKELEYTAKIVNKLNLKLETVYVGGGTPTTLNAVQLKMLLDTIRRNFNMKECREFTVEAGRPDTITEEKLITLKNAGVERISINPQTLNDKVLTEIGRKHTALESIEALKLAKSMNFQNINTDLIAGLPLDTVKSFKYTLDTIIGLEPQSITVHTLAMKKSSNLTAQGLELYRDDAVRTGEMHRYCKDMLTVASYIPYYLYRQSRMVGNYENVGWSQKGCEGLYNVYVMDETHTILGCGAGAVSKLKAQSGYLERVFNYKYPYEYISDFDTMLLRKERFISFYDEYYK